MCMLGGVLSLKSLNILFVIELHIVLRFSRRAVFRGAAIYKHLYKQEEWTDKSHN